MRLLRALAHLALALAFTVGAIAQSVGVAPVATFQHPDGRNAAAQVVHAAHDHGMATNDGPVHERDGCQTACCLAPAQLPTRAPEVSTVGFFCAVRYVEALRSGSGRAFAPDPEIPKLIA